MSGCPANEQAESSSCSDDSRMVVLSELQQIHDSKATEIERVLCLAVISAATAAAAETTTSSSKTNKTTATEQETAQLLWQLREFSISEGGLVNDAIRRKVWPLLLGCSSNDDQRQHQNDSNCKTSTTSSSNQRSNQHNELQQQRKNRNTKDEDIEREDEEEEKKNEEMEQVPNRFMVTTEFRNKDTPLCLDALQVERDVARCTHHLLHSSCGTSQPLASYFMSITPQQERLLYDKQKVLFELLNRVLLDSAEHPNNNNNQNSNSTPSKQSLQKLNNTRLHYYQGYHEVGSIVLSTMMTTLPQPPKPTTSKGKSSSKKKRSSVAGRAKDTPPDPLDPAISLLSHLSYSHLRDFLRPDFYQLQMVLRLTVMPLIHYLDFEMSQHFESCDMEPFFCLSWVITWFARDLSNDTALVKRLFDLFLVGHPLLPMYLSVAFVLHPVNREYVLGSEPGDFASLHRRLRQLPSNCCDTTMQARSDNHHTIHESSTSDKGSRSPSPSPPSSPSRGIVARDSNDSICSLDESDGDDFSMPESIFIPIQEIIDLSLVMMKRIPPKDLLDGNKSLASRYYSPPVVEQMLQHQKMSSETNNRSILMEPNCVQSHAHLLTQQPYIKAHLNKSSVVVLGCALGYFQERRLRKTQKRQLLLVAFFLSTFINFAVLGTGAILFGSLHHEGAVVVSDMIDLGEICSVDDAHADSDDTLSSLDVCPNDSIDTFLLQVEHGVSYNGKAQCFKSRHHSFKF